MALLQGYDGDTDSIDVVISEHSQLGPRQQQQVAKVSDPGTHARPGLDKQREMVVTFGGYVRYSIANTTLIPPPTRAEKATTFRLP